METMTFWGVLASPFQLKMQALASAAHQPWRRWPDQARFGNSFRTLRRLRRARKTLSIERFGGFDCSVDEYPTLPFYSFDNVNFFYDSTGLAEHLDSRSQQHARLIPTAPELKFICCLIDEAFDEFGLYMVHHNRWVTSARTNCMGKMTAREMRSLAPPPLRGKLSRDLAKRQAARCAYLFSVSPPGFSVGMSQALTPPALDGFPPTHDLLDEAWCLYLQAMEAVLSQQPFLLGERFTLADASAYGQLSMNLVDGRAAELLQQLAPTTFAWLCMIRDGKHLQPQGDLYLNDALGPLLNIIMQTFAPLMQQNHAAYTAALAAGQTVFNQAAFDRGEALYEGQLLGQPFKTVAKSFQVPVWRTVCKLWESLETAHRQQVSALCSHCSDAGFATENPAPV